MENMNLVIDAKLFPELNKRYSEERLKDQLILLCQKNNLEVNEKNMYAMAAALESDLEHMFS